MNATTAIAKALLEGRVLTIKTAFKEFGVSNLPREVGRAIERKFGVQVAKVKKNGKSRYGVECYWYEYRLPSAPYNKEGIERMQVYVDQHWPKSHPEIKTEPKTNTLF